MQKNKFFFLGAAFILLVSSSGARAGWNIFSKKKDVVIPPINTVKQPLPIIGVRLGDVHFVPCEHCGGAGGLSQNMKCGPDQFMTNFENAVGQYGPCDTDWGGCSNHAIVGWAKYQCMGINLDTVEFASTYAKTDSGATMWGVPDPSKLDHWGDGCLSHNGVPYGIFGRGGDRVDSFGFFCGTYLRTPSKVQIIQDSPKPTTYQCPEEVKYGCSPGTGGAFTFEVKCPIDQGIVGIKARTGGDVDAIEGIYCANVEFIRQIFPTDDGR